MLKDNVIVFVCEHGAAKSIIAAAYFNKLANGSGLQARAISRGTHPDAELSPKAVAGLQADGLAPIESFPQKLSSDDVESAQRVITFCELPKEYHVKAVVEQWDGVPPVSEDYDKARNSIVEKLNLLIDDIA